MKRFWIILTISYVALITACSSLPFAERQSNATTELSERWSRDQNERLQAVFKAASTSTNGVVVDWTADNREQGNGDQSLISDFENSIPGGLKLVYWGIGILVVLFAVRQVTNTSAAAKVIATRADEAIAKQIRKLEGKLSGEQNADKKAELLQMLKDLENERGKLKT